MLYFLCGLHKEFPRSRPVRISSFFHFCGTVVTRTFLDPDPDTWTQINTPGCRTETLKVTQQSSFDKKLVYELPYNDGSKW
jgi:hypothetical protein